MYDFSPFQIQLLIDDVDMTASIFSLPSINRSIDTQNVNHYRVGECHLTLNDPTGQLSPAQNPNFFTRRNKPQDGADVSVEIKTGNPTLTTQFKGTITSLAYNRTSAQTTLRADDSFHTLYTTRITNFGEDKHFKLVEDTDVDTLNGEYRLPDMVTPISDDSSTVSKSVSQDLTEVESLSTRGAFNPNHYEVVNDAILTEGGPITGAATGYPQIECKSPYRHIPVKTVISKIATHLGITSTDIEIPIHTGDATFTTLGRTAYPLLATTPFGSSNPASMQGYATDQLIDGTTHYIAYTAIRGVLGSTSFLCKRDIDTGEYTLLWRAPSSATHTTELWKIAKNGNNIAMLLTDSEIQPSGPGALPDVSVPASGSYNCTETGNKVYIVERDITLPSSNATLATLVGKNNTLKAQLAHHYVMGQTYGDARAQDAEAIVPPQQPTYNVPDSRRRILYYNNDLYYVFATSTEVGVAKTRAGTLSSKVDSIKRDDLGNETGFHFDIISNRIYMVANRNGQVNGKEYVWTKTL